MALLAWHIWLILGIIFIIIEIFDPAFFFLSLGSGAIITGLLALSPFVKRYLWLQILIFAIISFIAFLLMRRLGKRVLADSGPQTNVFALKGKLALVTEAIPADGRGRAKVGSEEWVATTADHSAIAEGAKVEILDIHGNKLIVKEIEQ
ncbi:MAG: NfeD family protein [Candidatus Cloacimonadaceae bacterium]|jgi:membrane protein implicated in regulation of membrane protease activity|nr:NfeD family protein [Candidatus Cloacimonadota bacterium]MDY0127698.1 NfeD family protein [Candidatus Cloacimonadaceae bacterium]MCB5254768.1 NfeD family protein [Candidatus Cloacimonadota bacterium]MCK9178010.1 NfeD family protein [Candidatus Cloacimonadota bacterium]MCK9242347.1 NfeD family protein [Candidatus Cloacimonadota bacterium]